MRALTWSEILTAAAAAAITSACLLAADKLAVRMGDVASEVETANLIATLEAGEAPAQRLGDAGGVPSESSSRIHGAQQGAR